jgi:hypothetical protein
MLALCITKPYSKLLASSPSWGPTPTTLTPVAPCVAPPALGTPATDTIISCCEPEATSARSLGASMAGAEE